MGLRRGGGELCSSFRASIPGYVTKHSKRKTSKSGSFYQTNRQTNKPSKSSSGVSHANYTFEIQTMEV